MTIKIIEAPSRSECWWHVDSNVRAVTEHTITYHDGSENHKNYFAKVEILSIMDAPEDWEERKEFYRNLLNLPDDYLISPFEGYLSRMTDAKFEAIDLPNHI